MYSIFHIINWFQFLIINRFRFSAPFPRSQSPHKNPHPKQPPNINKAAWSLAITAAELPLGINFFHFRVNGAWELGGFFPFLTTEMAEKCWAGTKKHDGTHEKRPLFKKGTPEKKSWFGVFWCWSGCFRARKVWMLWIWTCTLLSLLNSSRNWCGQSQKMFHLRFLLTSKIITALCFCSSPKS